MVRFVSTNFPCEKLRCVVVTEWRGNVVCERVEIAIVDFRTVVNRGYELDWEAFEECVWFVWVVDV